MHSYILQISTLPISEDLYLSEDTLLDRAQDAFGSTYVDYVAELDADRRAELIPELGECLPAEMFEINADGTYTYLGGYEEWVKKFFIPNIHEAAMCLNVEDCPRLGLGSFYEVQKRIENPLELSCLFVITENQNPQNVVTEPVKKSGDFMFDFVKYLKPGDKIYIGGVYDYHF